EGQKGQGRTTYGEERKTKRLFAAEVVHRDGVFKQGIVARDHGDTALGYEVALAVGFRVIADAGAFGNVHIAVDDGLANAAMAAHVHVGKKNAGIDLAVRVHPDIGREDAVFHRAAGYDAAGGNDRVQRLPGASRFGEDELGRRILLLVGTD